MTEEKFGGENSPKKNNETESAESSADKESEEQFNDKKSEKFNRGLSYIGSMREDQVKFILPIAERWRESRIAFIALVNAPYYFKLIRIDYDSLSILCWLLITTITARVLLLNSSDTENHVDWSLKILEKYNNAEFKGVNISTNNAKAQKTWYKKFVKSVDEYVYGSDLMDHKITREKNIMKIKKLQIWAVSALLVSAVNQYATKMFEFRANGFLSKLIAMIIQ